MGKNWFLLGSVAFGISFSISLLTSRDAGKAIATGLTTTAASVVAAIVVDRRSYGQLEDRVTTLKNHIRALQQRRAEAYQALVEIEAEREQFAVLNMGTFHPQPLQLPSSPHPSRKILSWNLSAPVIAESAIRDPSAASSRSTSQVEVKPHDLPTQIQLPKPVGGETKPAFAEATETQRQLEANYSSLQQELKGLDSQILEHRQTRTRLVQEVAELKGQKQQLEEKVQDLRREVQNLENYRAELEQFLSYVEAKKQELETGANPLQHALRQLQAQVKTSEEELCLLETQIAERRSQKETLEQQLASLNAQQRSTEQVLSNASQSEPDQPEHNIPQSIFSKLKQPPKNSIHSKPLEKTNSHGSGNRPAGKSGSNSSAGKETSSTIAPSATTSNAALQRPLKESSVAVSAPVKLEKLSTNLSDEWTEFLLQLPEYELEVLRAIVEQSNPAPVIKRIAEENLTMPELLVDSINERALDTIGDLIIESSSSSGSATIARDHLKAVKKLIKTYEYLSE